jgi:hypothetical protein
LGAPILLLFEWWSRSGPFPAETLTSAIIAVGAVPVHPIFPRAWAAGVTVLGLVAWLFCSIIVAAAPA